MNLNMAGEALDSDGVTILQCDPSQDPTRQAKYQQDRARCQQIAAAWLPKSERRIAIVKDALRSLIAGMQPFDTMQVVGYSGATADWISGTTAGKQQLTDALLTIGATNADPYTTSGGSSPATSLHMARERMVSGPATSVDGREFKHAALLLTDSVANYFLNSSNPGTGFSWYNDAHDSPSCAASADRDTLAACQVGVTNTIPAIERPLTALASEAAEIKALNGGATVLYVLALGEFDKRGLASDVASERVFPYYSQSTSTIDTVTAIQNIYNSIETVICYTNTAPTWQQNTIDAAHTVTDTAQRTALGLPTDTSVYGYVYLSDQLEHSLQTVPIYADTTTGMLSYTITNLAPGEYRLRAFLVYKGDDQPTPIARRYSSLIRNGTPVSNISLVLDPGSSGSTVQADPLHLGLQSDVNLCPGL